MIGMWEFGGASLFFVGFPWRKKSTGSTGPCRSLDKLGEETRDAAVLTKTTSFTTTGHSLRAVEEYSYFDSHM